MYKSFLIKTAFLVIALAAVVALIVTVTNADFSGAATKSTQTQTFFEQFVIAGGPIVWFVLLPMSLIMVFLVVEYSLTIRRKKLLPNGAGPGIVSIIRQFGPTQLSTRFADRDDLVSTAVVSAINQSRGDWFRMRNTLFESLEEQALRLMRRIEWINLIGSVSPMVGLFGTVFGMIKLFNAIVIAGGQPQPAQLAGGISVALVTTFWGLLIAIPALAIHGVFRNRIETIVSDATTEAENVLTEIRPSLKIQKPTHQPKPKQPIQELKSKPTPPRHRSLPLR